MTGDELDRAIDFLLKNQARHDARIEQLNGQLARNSEQIARNGELIARNSEQIAQINSQVERAVSQNAQTSGVLREYTGMHSQLVRVVTRTFEAQSEINDSFRAELKGTRDSLRAKMSESRESFRAELKEMREEFDARGRRIDERLDRLAGLVELHLRGGRGGAE